MSLIAQKIIAGYKEHYSLPHEPASASHLEDCIDSAIAALEAERDALKASDALRATLIRDVLHRFAIGEEEYYSSGGFSLLEVIDQLRAENTALRKALMKLRGAIDGLGLDYPYLSDCKAEAIEVLSRIPERRE